MLLFFALYSYWPDDRNFIFSENTKINNFLGFKGSFISDLFFQSIGLIAYLISLTFIITGVNLFRRKEFFLIIENSFYLILYCIFGSLFFAHFYSDAFTLYINGNGGFVGDYLNQTFLNKILLINNTISYYGLIICVSLFFLISINFHPIKFYKTIKKNLDLFKKKEKN